MKALVFDKSLRFVPDYPDPSPCAGEALIRVTCAGICNTDLEIAKGYMGFSGILGHEFVGVVEKSPDTRFLGKRVVGEINCPCGKCEMCKLGLGRHCPTRTVLGIAGRNGAFAERLTLPVENLHLVPDNLPDDEAVFTEPTAAAFEILEQLPGLGRKDSAAVLGDGKLGLIVAQVLATTGCRLLAIGKHPKKLSILKARRIETALVPRLARSAPPSASSRAPRFDYVVDCTGSPSGFELANKLVRPRGTIVLKTTVADAAPLNLVPIVINEITVVGSRCGPFPPAFESLRTRKVDVRPLITATFPIEKGLTAMRRAAQKGILKILLRFDKN
jgi:threonine dehydrogenase-like Zn-dependent dehydrogenase